MSKAFKFRICFILYLLPVIVTAQHNATVKLYEKAFTTYPFSNPNPDPNPASLIYPYFRYDGFTDKAVQKEWKVVELDNDFIKEKYPLLAGTVDSVLGANPFGKNSDSKNN